MALADDIAEKKRALDAARPLPLDVVHGLADWYEMELTVSGLLVERASLTRDEVKQVLDRGPVLRHRPPAEQRLALNHRLALQLLARLSYDATGATTERTITAFHAILFQNIDESPGAYREGPLVDSTVNVTPDPAKVRVSMSALSGWLRRTEPSPEAAFEAHHRLMAVRPFDRGNAAVALMLCNLILNRAGYPPVAVREEEAGAYLEAVDRAAGIGDRNPFRALMADLLDQSLDISLVGAARAVAGRVGADA